MYTNFDLIQVSKGAPGFEKKKDLKLILDVN